jgi:hypothetical protein
MNFSLENNIMTSQFQEVREHTQVTAPAQIARIHASFMTPTLFFEQYQQLGTPVVITGLLDSEPDWDLDFLCQKLNAQEFAVRCYGSDRYQQDKRQWTDIGSGVELRKMTFLKYAASLRSGEAHRQDMYLAKCPIRETELSKTPVFRSAVEQLGLRFPASNFNLWVGPGGHVECLHYDASDGTLMQLHGEKKLLLFPPSQTYNLYPFPVYAHFRHGLKLRSWFSQVYPDAPDFKAFPKLREALQHRYEVILRRGELLYIPVGWWHEVTALGNEMSCSVNQFWHVYPLRRALRSWVKWRAHLGSICAIPHSLVSLLGATFSKNQTDATLRHRL